MRISDSGFRGDEEERKEEVRKEAGRKILRCAALVPQLRDRGKQDERGDRCRRRRERRRKEI
jgi:hypothetical protein